MSNEDGGSSKLLPTGLDSAGIHDFLYVDRARISALYAQLFPQGLLTGVKTTKQQTFSDEGDVGTDIKIFKAQAKTVEGGSEGIEHVFDASWAIPLEVLSRLVELGLVRDSLNDANLGSIVLNSCYLRILDFSSMENLWEPALKTAVALGQLPLFASAEAASTLTEIFKATPRAIQAQFLTNNGLLWSSLAPGGLTIPTHDLTLKFGGSISGVWRVLFIVDAWPDNGESPDVKAGWSAGPLMDGVLIAMNSLKQIMGKPSSWYAVTPLMIYRTIEPATTQAVLDFVPSVRS